MSDDDRSSFLPPEAKAVRTRILELVPGLLAGVAGGIAASFLLKFLMAWQGLWMPIITGAIVGLACGQASPVASRARGLIIALFTLGLVVVIQWQRWTPPFETDGSLSDYVQHLHELPAMTLVLMAINVVIAYWWGRERGIRFDSARRRTDEVAVDGSPR